jgi:hypothetical protein
MRKLLYLFFLLVAVACKKQHDDVPEQPTLKKLEWHVYASENDTGPWLNSMTARVEVRIYKSDTVNHILQTIWDTTFVDRTLRNYPRLPQKHVLKKEVPLLLREKLQLWYNIRYEMAGSASETGHLQVVQQPFTFIDVRI